MSNPILIATSVPGLLNQPLRLRELSLAVLNKCEYIILDRDNYLRGIEDPALDVVKDKNVLFIRLSTVYLDSFEDLKRNAKHNVALAAVLKTLEGKEVVVLGFDFFDTLHEFVTTERELENITNELKKKMNNVTTVNKQ